MLLFSERMKLRDLFYEWVDKEQFGERSVDHFMIFMLSNNLIDEEKTKRFIENTKGADHNA